MWSTWTLKTELPSLEDREGEGQCGSGKLNVDGDRFCCRTQHTKLLSDAGSVVTLIREEVWKELKVTNRGVQFGSTSTSSGNSEW